MENWVRRLTLWAHRIEAPTWLLAFTIYGAWVALTFYWLAVPIWIELPLGAWLCAWQMSLQHELIHGHPTRHEWVNFTLAVPPLNLWLPYSIYREQHLRHHRAADLTDPVKDPESTYMLPESWAGASAARRFIHGACNTFIGRILLGPPWMIAQFWGRQARLAMQGRGPWLLWLGHALGVALVLVWVCVVCHISLLAYLAFFVYPGTALTMIRSLAEHRAAERPEDRTAVVENAGLLGLLFLNNNLHVLHHERPSIPWYALPSVWRGARQGLLGVRGGPVYQGYREVALRYAWKKHHAGPHPIEKTVLF